MSVTSGAPRRSDDERGFALVLFALVLVTLLVFASFAVDFGGLYNERRQDQNAADSGALAAAQDIGNPAQMRDQAMDFAESTVGVDFTATQWNSCSTDSGALANSTPGANCITYEGRQVRVRIPDQQYDTVFGAVVGADQFRHSAFAVAGLETEGFGGVLPFGVAGTTAQGGYSCLQSNSAGQSAPVCNGSISGNFRFLDFSDFGASDVRTIDCGNNGTQDSRMRASMAMGIDHDLSVFGSVHPGQVQDHQACAANPQGNRPNAVDTRTGNQANDATTGLIAGSGANFPDGDPARLRRSDPLLLAGDGGAPARITVLGTSDLDNTPLWRFIPANYGPGETTTANIPTSCKRDQFVRADGTYYPAATDNPDLSNTVETFTDNLTTEAARQITLMQRCMDHFRNVNWTGGPFGTVTAEAPSGCTQPCSPVFVLNSQTTDEPDLYDIQYTPRFGYVPELDGFGNGNNTRRIVDFHAIYIQRLRLEVSGPDIDWDPGVSPVPPTASTNYTLGETSMFVFPDGSLPNGLADTNAPYDPGSNRFVRLIR